jgi:hypothetical protein
MAFLNTMHGLPKLIFLLVLPYVYQVGDINKKLKNI